jgi:hypothetical protein
MRSNISIIPIRMAIRASGVSRSRLSQFHRDCGAPFSHDRSGDGGSRKRRRVSRGSGRSTYRNFIVVPDVCFGSFADMVPVSRHVRFASHSGDSWPGCETSYRDGSPKAGDANQSVRVPQPILDGSSQLPPGTFLNKSSPRNHFKPLDSKAASLAPSAGCSSIYLRFAK